MNELAKKKQRLAELRDRDGNAIDQRALVSEGGFLRSPNSESQAKLAKSKMPDPTAQSDYWRDVDVTFAEHLAKAGLSKESERVRKSFGLLEEILKASVRGMTRSEHNAFRRRLREIDIDK